jgi:predicted amidohydrolase
MAVKEGARLQNASVHFGPDGSRHVYAKIHLFEAEPNVESRVFEPGAKRVLWSVEGIPVGPVLCYDLRFPELTRSLCLDGAKVILASSAWPASRREVFRVLSQARAIENQCFLLSANLAGRSLSGSFAGHSMIVGPDGGILGEGKDGDELLVATLDFAALEKARSFLPCFQQRRPDCYRL